MRPFQINSESTKLQSVIIGMAHQFRSDPSYVEIVNSKQGNCPEPSEATLIQELSGFESMLKAAGIEVITPSHVGNFVPDQLTPRDIGFVIGDTFVVSNMRKASRRYEVFGILETLGQFDTSNQKVLIPEAEVSIEGGDVIVDKGCIYVGQSNRTNRQGFEFIQSQFSDEFTVYPIEVNDLPEESKYLHLDCVFNPVGHSHVLFHSDGVLEVPKEILEKYELIEITAAEQEELAANVLTISSDTVIARRSPNLQRVNDQLRKHYEVIELDFSSVVATGGSFRCASLPLVRQ